MGTVVRASSKERVDRDKLECVRGQMGFARRSPAETAPEIVVPNYANDMRFLSYEVTIRNARPIVEELSLDREGFTLVHHKTPCADVRDPAVMRDKYLEEMVPFIKNYFNASWVMPSRRGVVVRSAGMSSNLAPVASTAHIDYALIAAPVIAATVNQEQGIPIRPYSRMMIIHAWRALSSPPQDFPLACSDAGTILDTDLIVTDYDRNGPMWHKTCQLCFNPGIRWYYFPEMTPDELILFKGYDSEDNCNARSGHTAFDNRRAYPNAKPRESVEARFFVYYD